MDLEELGNRLKSHRKHAGIPLAELARRASVGRSTLWIWEEGHNPKTGKPSRPSLDGLEKVLDALHLDGESRNELLEFAGYQAGPVEYAEESAAISARGELGQEPSASRARFGSALPVSIPSRKEQLSEILDQLDRTRRLVEELLREETE